MSMRKQLKCDSDRNCNGSGSRNVNWSGNMVMALGRIVGNGKGNGNGNGTGHSNGARNRNRSGKPIWNRNGWGNGDGTETAMSRPGGVEWEWQASGMGMEEAA